MSNGVRFSPGFPPIVPLMPEMLFINATMKSCNVRKLVNDFAQAVVKNHFSKKTNFQQQQKYGFQMSSGGWGVFQKLPPDLSCGYKFFSY